MTPSTSIQKSSTKPLVSLQFFLVLAFLLLLVLLFYTFAHEGGHALLAFLFGGRLTTFSVNFFNLSAHVGLDGEFTTAQNAIISAGGVSLPYLLFLALIFRAPKNADPVLEWFKLLAFLGTVNSLLAWVVIPFLAANGQTIGDDSANFLRYTQFSPWLISGATLLVYLAGWAAYLSRAGGWRGLSNRLRSQAVDLSVPGSRKSFLTLVVAGVVVGAASLALTLALPNRFLDAPTGYQLAAEMDLSAKPLSGETVYSFHLDKPSTVSLFFPLRKVEGAPVKIWLAGPDGYENAFLVNTDPKFNAERATVHPQDLPLGPGSYEIHITAPQGSGSISIFTLVE